MTTFYDHGFIRVTEQWLTIGSHRYPIDQLHNLRTARGPVGPIAPASVVMFGVAALITTVAGLLLPPSAVASVAAFTLVPSAVIAVLRARFHSPTYLLLGDYRGADTLLFESDDETDFGKISRAVARARYYQGRSEEVRYVVLVTEEHPGLRVKRQYPPVPGDAAA